MAFLRSPFLSASVSSSAGPLLRLAYVWTGSDMVNERLVREGWAMLYTLPPNVKYAGRLERAQKEARSARTGLWRTGGFECSPRAWRRRECASAP
jgi:micrococcal nuclease